MYAEVNTKCSATQKLDFLQSRHFYKKQNHNNWRRILAEREKDI